MQRVPVSLSGRMAPLVLLLAWGCMDLSAQSGSGMERMENELCGCLTMIDVKARNEAFEGQVRHCLEDAVIHHPAAMNALLRTAGGAETKGFQLGEVLGRELEPRCPAFRPIRERLRRLHPDGAVLKNPS